MKVLLVNGSPNAKRGTFTILSEVANALNAEGIDTEIFHIGTKPLSGCIDCGHCLKNSKCVFDDSVNAFLEKAAGADGFVFGSPVHYASAGGAITSFMDRAFYADACSGGRRFYLKPAAAVVIARRAGTTAAFDQLNKYFTISEMPIISSRYWNMAHSSRSADDVRKDEEGMQIMRMLGRNMAWFLKCKEAGMKAGVKLPTQEERIFTNFIR